MARSRSLLALLGAALVFTTAGAPGADKPKAPAATPAPATPEAKLIEGFSWREIGPFRGGRVTAVAGVPGQPLVYYFGATGGGVWKTTDARRELVERLRRPVRTARSAPSRSPRPTPTSSTSGMGESCIRGNVSHGDGVYTSTDAGKTWTHVGLARHAADRRASASTRRTPTSSTSPRSGTPVGPERRARRLPLEGRRQDAGRRSSSSTTRRAPSTSRWTPPTRACSTPRPGRCGARPGASRAAGPAAASGRRPTAATPGRSSTAKGLPKGPLGTHRRRPSRPPGPERVWAMVEAEEGGVFRSDDAGATWQRTNDDRRAAPARLVLHAHLRRPEGRRHGLRAQRRVLPLERRRQDVPVDPHAARRQPRPVDRTRRPAADDRGQRRRRQRLASTAARPGRDQDNQPTAQFYHVIADDQFPYRVYGAQQDNSHRRDRRAGPPAPGIGAARLARGRRLRERLHRAEAGRSRRRLRRLLRRLHHAGSTTARASSATITVWPDNPMGWGAEGMKYRFQWTFPIVFSPHDPDVALRRRQRALPHAQRGLELGGDLAPT